MLTDEISSAVARALRFEPTADQSHAIKVFARFLVESFAHPGVMVLRGAAGTGKTSLASAFVHMLLGVRHRVCLMAPTGRAAKVFAQHSGHEAFTIHRVIYRERAFAGTESQFSLAPNLKQNTIFLVDESSMIANSGFGGQAFGSGRLLDDLVRYVYSGRRCRMVLIGDKAQLPPVGETESPALSASELESFGLRVYEADLDEVLRQSVRSGILFNATIIRRVIQAASHVLPRIRLRGFADVCVVGGAELIEALGQSYHDVGLDETIVITRSNKRANIYNQGIRTQVLDMEGSLCQGDMLMAVRNKYLAPSHPDDGLDVARLASDAEAEGNEVENSPSFIANGDRLEVVRVRHERELYGFHFADVTLRLTDYEGAELQQTACLDSLVSEAPALTREQQQSLFNQVLADYADIPRKADRMKKMRDDVYLGALQIKYAYAVTCHKAQGGQWQHVFIDQGYMTEEMLTPDYLHWLYTAFTRATSRLYLVNWPEGQIEV